MLTRILSGGLNRQPAERAIHKSSNRHSPLMCQPSGSDASAVTQDCESAPSGAIPASVGRGASITVR